VPALLAVVAVFAVVAVGCQESGFDESKETSKPLKVQHVLGETKVPGQSELPLTLTYDSLDDTLALGLRPVAAAVPGAALPPYLREPAAGVALKERVTAADLDEVRAVDPDLILGNGVTQAALYNDLSRIAPTVMTENGGGQWKLNLRLVGEALGRTNDAEELLIDYDHEAALARRAIRREWRAREGGAAARRRPPRVAIARITSDGLEYAPPISFAGTILADTQVRQVTKPSAKLRPDVTLLFRTPDAKPDVKVKGRVEQVDGALWWGPGGAIAGKEALADLKQALAG
jgi:ABC-type Fe3+-hydroxamate transport system substrate-binding protein